MKKHEIRINHFFNLMLKPKIINKINNIDRYFEVYLQGEKITEKFIAEIKINLTEPIKNKIKFIKSGSVYHATIPLKLNSFMTNYEENL